MRGKNDVASIARRSLCPDGDEVFGRSAESIRPLSDPQFSIYGALEYRFVVTDFDEFGEAITSYLELYRNGETFRFDLNRRESINFDEFVSGWDDE